MGNLRTANNHHKRALLRLRREAKALKEECIVSTTGKIERSEPSTPADHQQ